MEHLPRYISQGKGLRPWMSLRVLQDRAVSPPLRHLGSSTGIGSHTLNVMLSNEVISFTNGEIIQSHWNETATIMQCHLESSERTVMLSM